MSVEINDIYTADNGKFKGQLMRLGHSFTQATVEGNEELARAVLGEARLFHEVDRLLKVERLKDVIRDGGVAQEQIAAAYIPVAEGIYPTAMGVVRVKLGGFRKSDRTNKIILEGEGLVIKKGRLKTGPFIRTRRRERFEPSRRVVRLPDTGADVLQDIGSDERFRFRQMNASSH